jgi:hypothetical protein
MKLYSLVFGVVCVFVASAAAASTVGFYAATFDPPTRAQLQMIRCALGEPPLREECRELGKEISRMIVLVDDDRERDTLASTRERVLMLNKALQKHAERVEVMASTPVQKKQRKRAVLGDPNVARVLKLVGAESYRAFKSSAEDQNPKLAWVVFPLSGENVPRHGGLSLDDQIDFAASEVVDKLGLYREVDPELADLQKSFFEEGWRDFLQDLQTACPMTIEKAKCSELASHWKEIPVVRDEQIGERARREPAGKVRLVYRKTQSGDRWAEKFTSTALHFLDGTEHYDKFKAAAADMSARVFQGYPRGKLPHLSRVSLGAETSIDRLRAVQMPLACSAPQGRYIADMDRYVADRFPRALSRFLNDEFLKGSISLADLYVHDHPIEEAYEFHRRDGYDAFYFAQTRRGHLHRHIHIAVKSHPRAYRIVLTGVRGRDRQANVLCQVQRAQVFSTYNFIQSREPEQLFVLNRKGQSLTLHPTDWLLFGFKGDWSRKLSAQGFRQVPLVIKGLDIDLFSRPGIGTKIVVARNVYGDDAEIVLSTFYKKGIRQAIYLGTAGAIADYKIGDVVIPNKIVDRHKNSVPFARNFARSYRSEISGLLTVHADKKHASVQSLFDETEEVLLDWKVNAVGSVDVEGIHLARFAMRHDDLKLAAFFVISDETLGALTIEQTNALRGVIDESVARVIEFLLPKLFNEQQDAERGRETARQIGPAIPPNMPAPKDRGIR